MKRGVVYFLSDGEAIKIGMTERLKRRIYQLERETGCKLNLLAALPTPPATTGTTGTLIGFALIDDNASSSSARNFVVSGLTNMRASARNSLTSAPSTTRCARLARP